MTPFPCCSASSPGEPLSLSQFSPLPSPASAARAPAAGSPSLCSTPSSRPRRQKELAAQSEALRSCDLTASAALAQDRTRGLRGGGGDAEGGRRRGEAVRDEDAHATDCEPEAAAEVPGHEEAGCTCGGRAARVARQTRRLKEALNPLPSLRAELLSPACPPPRGGRARRVCTCASALAEPRAPSHHEKRERNLADRGEHDEEIFPVSRGTQAALRSDGTGREGEGEKRLRGGAGQRDAAEGRSECLCPLWRHAGADACSKVATHEEAPSREKKRLKKTRETSQSTRSRHASSDNKPHLPLQISLSPSSSSSPSFSLSSCLSYLRWVEPVGAAPPGGFHFLLVFFSWAALWLWRPPGPAIVAVACVLITRLHLVWLLARLLQSCYFSLFPVKAARRNWPPAASSRFPLPSARPSERPHENGAPASAPEHARASSTSVASPLRFRVCFLLSAALLLTFFLCSTAHNLPCFGEHPFLPFALADRPRLLLALGAALHVLKAYLEQAAALPSPLAALLSSTFLSNSPSGGAAAPAPLSAADAGVAVYFHLARARRVLQSFVARSPVFAFFHDSLWAPFQRGVVAPLAHAVDPLSLSSPFLSLLSGAGAPGSTAPPTSAAALSVVALSSPSPPPQPTFLSWLLSLLPSASWLPAARSLRSAAPSAFGFSPISPPSPGSITQSSLAPASFASFSAFWPFSAAPPRPAFLGGLAASAPAGELAAFSSSPLQSACLLFVLWVRQVYLLLAALVSALFADILPSLFASVAALLRSALPSAPPLASLVAPLLPAPLLLAAAVEFTRDAALAFLTALSLYLALVRVPLGCAALLLRGLRGLTAGARLLFRPLAAPFGARLRLRPTSAEKRRRQRACDAQDRIRHAELSGDSLPRAGGGGRAAQGSARRGAGDSALTSKRGGDEAYQEEFATGTCTRHSRRCRRDAAGPRSSSLPTKPDVRICISLAHHALPGAPASSSSFSSSVFALSSGRRGPAAGASASPLHSSRRGLSPSVAAGRPPPFVLRDARLHGESLGRGEEGGDDCAARGCEKDSTPRFRCTEFFQGEAASRPPSSSPHVTAAVAAAKNEGRGAVARVCRASRASGTASAAEVLVALVTCYCFLFPDRRFVLFFCASLQRLHALLVSLHLLATSTRVEVALLLDSPPPVERLLAPLPPPLRVIDPAALGAAFGALLGVLLLLRWHSAAARAGDARPQPLPEPVGAETALLDRAVERAAREAARRKPKIWPPALVSSAARRAASLPPHAWCEARPPKGAPAAAPYPPPLPSSPCASLPHASSLLDSSRDASSPRPVGAQAVSAAAGASTAALRCRCRPPASVASSPRAQRGEEAQGGGKGYSSSCVVLPPPAVSALAGDEEEAPYRSPAPADEGSGVAPPTPPLSPLSSPFAPPARVPAAGAAPSLRHPARLYDEEEGGEGEEEAFAGERLETCAYLPTARLSSAAPASADDDRLKILSAAEALRVTAALQKLPCSLHSLTSLLTTLRLPLDVSLSREAEAEKAASDSARRCAGVEKEATDEAAEGADEAALTAGESLGRRGTSSLFADDLLALPPVSSHLSPLLLSPASGTSTSPVSPLVASTLFLSSHHRPASEGRAEASAAAKSPARETAQAAPFEDPSGPSRSFSHCLEALLAESDAPRDVDDPLGLLHSIQKLQNALPADATCCRLRLIEGEKEKMRAVEQKLLPIVRLPRPHARLRILYVALSLRERERTLSDFLRLLDCAFTECRESPALTRFIRHLRLLRQLQTLPDAAPPLLHAESPSPLCAESPSVPSLAVSSTGGRRGAEDEEGEREEKERLWRTLHELNEKQESGALSPQARAALAGLTVAHLALMEMLHEDEVAQKRPGGESGELKGEEKQGAARGKAVEDLHRQLAHVHLAVDQCRPVGGMPSSPSSIRDTVDRVYEHLTRFAGDVCFLFRERLRHAEAYSRPFGTPLPRSSSSASPWQPPPPPPHASHGCDLRASQSLPASSAGAEGGEPRGGETRRRDEDAEDASRERGVQQSDAAPKDATPEGDKGLAPERLFSPQERRENGAIQHLAVYCETAEEAFRRLDARAEAAQRAASALLSGAWLRMPALSLGLQKASGALRGLHGPADLDAEDLAEGQSADGDSWKKPISEALCRLYELQAYLGAVREAHLYLRAHARELAEVFPAYPCLRSLAGLHGASPSPPSPSIPSVASSAGVLEPCAPEGLARAATPRSCNSEPEKLQILAPSGGPAMNARATSLREGILPLAQCRLLCEVQGEGQLTLRSPFDPCLLSTFSFDSARLQERLPFSATPASFPPSPRSHAEQAASAGVAGPATASSSSWFSSPSSSSASAAAGAPRPLGSPAVASPSFAARRDRSWVAVVLGRRRAAAREAAEEENRAKATAEMRSEAARPTAFGAEAPEEAFPPLAASAEERPRRQRGGAQTGDRDAAHARAEETEREGKEDDVSRKGAGEVDSEEERKPASDSPPSSRLASANGRGDEVCPWSSASSAALPEVPETLPASSREREATALRGAAEPEASAEAEAEGSALEAERPEGFVAPLWAEASVEGRDGLCESEERRLQPAAAFLNAELLARRPPSAGSSTTSRVMAVPGGGFFASLSPHLDTPCRASLAPSLEAEQSLLSSPSWRAASSAATPRGSPPRPSAEAQARHGEETGAIAVAEPWLRASARGDVSPLPPSPAAAASSSALAPPPSPLRGAEASAASRGWAEDSRGDMRRLSSLQLEAEWTDVGAFEEDAHLASSVAENLLVSLVRRQATLAAGFPRRFTPQAPCASPPSAAAAPTAAASAPAALSPCEAGCGGAFRGAESEGEHAKAEEEAERHRAAREAAAGMENGGLGSSRSPASNRVTESSRGSPLLRESSLGEASEMGEEEEDDRRRARETAEEAGELAQTRAREEGKEKRDSVKAAAAAEAQDAPGDASPREDRRVPCEESVMPQAPQGLVKEGGDARRFAEVGGAREVSAISTALLSPAFPLSREVTSSVGDEGDSLRLRAEFAQPSALAGLLAEADAKLSLAALSSRSTKSTLPAVSSPASSASSSSSAPLSRQLSTVSLPRSYVLSLLERRRSVAEARMQSSASSSASPTAAAEPTLAQRRWSLSARPPLGSAASLSSLPSARRRGRLSGLGAFALPPRRHSLASACASSPRASSFSSASSSALPSARAASSSASLPSSPSASSVLSYSSCASSAVSSFAISSSAVSSSAFASAPTSPSAGAASASLAPSKACKAACEALAPASLLSRAISLPFSSLSIRRRREEEHKHAGTAAGVLGASRRRLSVAHPAGAPRLARPPLGLSAAVAAVEPHPETWGPKGDTFAGLPKRTAHVGATGPSGAHAESKAGTSLASSAAGAAHAAAGGLQKLSRGRLAVVFPLQRAEAETRRGKAASSAAAIELRSARSLLHDKDALKSREGGAAAATARAGAKEKVKAPSPHNALHAPSAGDVNRRSRRREIHPKAIEIKKMHAACGRPRRGNGPEAKELSSRRTLNAAGVRSAHGLKNVATENEVRSARASAAQGGVISLRERTVVQEEGEKTPQRSFESHATRDSTDPLRGAPEASASAEEPTPPAMQKDAESPDEYRLETGEQRDGEEAPAPRLGKCCLPLAGFASEASTPGGGWGVHKPQLLAEVRASPTPRDGDFSPSRSNVEGSFPHAETRFVSGALRDDGSDPEGLRALTPVAGVSSPTAAPSAVSARPRASPSTKSLTPFSPFSSLFSTFLAARGARLCEEQGDGEAAGPLTQATRGEGEKETAISRNPASRGLECFQLSDDEAQDDARQGGFSGLSSPRFLHSDEEDEQRKACAALARCSEASVEHGREHAAEKDDGPGGYDF
ncbi:hypothetical protein BESB_085570 [Besnoitia besnoiti]|uniref:Transmembrane protein n=1 Tax=Besnoitia besnoiti TaxID=94643 RepID=A0A2A9M4F1_BESBE|nr:hypothetical protein BESB_085570 [Besnoitia besnoiti]PFH33358.1 hypothetical protein BESB_085570 [Besnoitia besnoiti]